MPYFSREQRDLYWSIQQPSLMEADHVFPAQSWFKDQPIAADTLISPPPERFRLGIHFEKIYQQWLQSHPHYQLIASNLQVQGEERTLGEFDLLVQVADLLEHWELAIKFYICIDDDKNPARWFGPDPSDTLHSKVSRLLEHQLALGQRPEAIALLQKSGLEVQTTRGIIKGRLYHRFNPERSSNTAPTSKEKPSTLPPGVASNHLRGWWLKDSELSRLKGLKIAYLDKKYWLSPVTSADKLELMDIGEAKIFIKEGRQIAPQFAILDDNQNELSRGFVLKDEWFEQIPEL